MVRIAWVLNRLFQYLTPSTHANAHQPQLIMGLFSKIKGEFIDVIEWLDSSNDTIVHRFERYGNEIKNGAKLTVRESQVAVFVNEGQLADVFKPGMYTLETENLPLLSTLKGWKYGFKSPFKAEVYFVNTKQFLDQKWGTPSPITLSDDRFGMFEVRAFGSYAFRVHDAAMFLKEVVGTDDSFTTEQVQGQIRSLINTRFTDHLGENEIPVEKLASNVNELSQAAHETLKPELEADYGLNLTKFLVENVSMPEEIKKEIFEYSRLGRVNTQQLAQLKMAKSIETAAANEGMGGAGMGMGVGMGMGNMMTGMMAQNMQNMNQQGQPQGQPQQPAAGGPPPMPGQAMFYVAVNGQQTGPFPMATLQGMVGQGQLTPQTNVWKEGMAAWAAASAVPELTTLFGAVPPPPPPA